EIVTKCGIMLQSKNRPQNKVHYYDTSKEHIIKSANRSLKNMKIDYIDLLLIHRPDPLMKPQEVASAFNQLKKEGKVKNFGVSNFLPHQFDMLQKFLDVPLITNQVEISVTELKQFENGTMEHCISNDISPMAWSPVGGGDIFRSNSERVNRLKKVLHEVANNHGIDGIDMIMYAWLLKHPASIMPVIGTGKENRINAAIESTKIELTKQEWFKIYEASRGREVA
ncbi:MAG: aldo/keto reductase, partial [Fusobacteriota bacterium]